MSMCVEKRLKRFNETTYGSGSILRVMGGVQPIDFKLVKKLRKSLSPKKTFVLLPEQQDIHDGKVGARSRLLSRSMRNGNSVPLSSVKVSGHQHALMLMLGIVPTSSTVIPHLSISTLHHNFSTFAVNDVPLLDIHRVAQIKVTHL
ncbi:hypothetical protein J6590_062183 [Homalodisca vitripennis]|nr:hypothetical protein J6590_062183 [Homalodisca vitripennis]